jgi:hypothetical protein
MWRRFQSSQALLQLHDEPHVVLGSQWDPAQRAAPWIAWVVGNVDCTVDLHREPVTQTYRVSMILIRQGTDWKLAHVHWSNPRAADEGSADTEDLPESTP